jgi:hypothetical protein
MNDPLEMLREMQRRIANALKAEDNYGRPHVAADLTDVINALEIALAKRAEGYAKIRRLIDKIRYGNMEERIAAYEGLCILLNGAE